MKKNRKLSPEQYYLLFSFVENSQEMLKNLTLVAAGKAARRELKFPISESSVKRAMQYFCLEKDPDPSKNFSHNINCKVSVLAKHLALLYREMIIPIPKEIKKLMKEK